MSPPQPDTLVAAFVTSTPFSEGVPEDWTDDIELTQAATHIYENYCDSRQESPMWTDLVDALDQIEQAKGDLATAEDKEERSDARDELASARDELDAACAALSPWFDAAKTSLLGAHYAQPIRSEVDKLLEELQQTFDPPAKTAPELTATPGFSFRPAPHEPDHAADAQRQSASEIKTLYAQFATGLGAIVCVLPVPLFLNIIGGLLSVSGVAWWASAHRRRSLRASALADQSRREFAAAASAYKAEYSAAEAKWRGECDAVNARNSALAARAEQEYLADVEAALSAWNKRRDAKQALLADLLAKTESHSLADYVRVARDRLSQLVCLVPIVGYLTIVEGSKLCARVALPTPTILPEQAVSALPSGKLAVREMNAKASRELLADLAAGSLLVMGTQLLQIVPIVDQVQVIGISDHTENAWIGEPLECVVLTLDRWRIAEVRESTERPSKLLPTLGVKLSLSSELKYVPTGQTSRKAGKSEVLFEFMHIGGRYPGLCRVCGTEVPEEARLDSHLFVRRTTTGDEWALVHSSCSPVTPLTTKKGTNELFRGQRFALPMTA
jgi:hypothetical protein